MDFPVEFWNLWRSDTLSGPLQANKRNVSSRVWVKLLEVVVASVKTGHWWFSPPHLKKYGKSSPNFGLFFFQKRYKKPLPSHGFHGMCSIFQKSAIWISPLRSPSPRRVEEFREAGPESCCQWSQRLKPEKGTPKSPILIGISIISHPFWGTTILGNIHIEKPIILINHWSTIQLLDQPPPSHPARRVTGSSRSQERLRGWKAGLRERLQLCAPSRAITKSCCLPCLRQCSFSLIADGFNPFEKH